MILSFTAIDTSTQFRKFSCQLDGLEMALDILNTITLQGHTILTANVADEDGCIELPTTAFDGQLLSESIHHLEEQWRAILNEPVKAELPNDNWYTDLKRQQIRNFEERINQLTLVINYYQQLYQQAQSYFYPDPRKDRLLMRYESALNLYQQQIELARAGQRRVQEKLYTLAH